MLQLIEDRIRRGVPKPKRASKSRNDADEEEYTPKKKEEIIVPPSPYRANVAMKVRENTAMLALKQRILGKEGSMLLDYRTAQSAGTFDPTSNFQDETGRFLPRKHSHKNIMGFLELGCLQKHYFGSSDSTCASLVLYKFVPAGAQTLLSSV